MSTSIVLSTLNARYQHSAFGLRYLYANLGDLRNSAKIMEFTINQNPKDIVESILKLDPKIVGFGVYIWNTRPVYDVISLLKQLKPGILVVAGGPEVSYETEGQAIYQLADYTIRGEADFLFFQFCRDFLVHAKLPSEKLISGELPDVKKIVPPYDYYGDEDIQHRILYVEASRGCPYKCEYCLSSLDKSVRNFDLDIFLSNIDSLIQRGARQFKFVDRTFNLSIATSSRILKFFLERIALGLFLHFEMVPDRLPLELRELIRQFPSGALQFEVGIQTWNIEVAKLVSRRQDYGKIKENFFFLRQETKVHIHADLIAGLPGEDINSFSTGFDAVAELNPHEIQVGILKRLKGTPIIQHEQIWGMIYQEFPPFQILCTKDMSFSILQDIGRFAQFWDLIANSGNFRNTLDFIKSLSKNRPVPSFFWEFYRFSRFLSFRHPQGNGIALINLVQSTWIYLTEELKIDDEEVREVLVKDYTGYIKRDVPPFLRKERFLKRNDAEDGKLPGIKQLQLLPKRQSRHTI